MRTEPRSPSRVVHLNSPSPIETVAKVSPVSSEDESDASITSLTREDDPEPVGPRQSTRDKRQTVRFPHHERS